ncbi:rubredoxin-like domain-containing protein [Treponema porcinum]|uniref:Rubredoxin n=1 Tax=Treponema porcinum TaxID=261392 RepID=A0A1T4KU13_TREPO|nr:rubredoxin [Treponema porcinum]SJZ45929.1 Rubredoxin [Treponema porcinum]
MKYICQICGYVYDDAKEKVPFAELPDDWKCPLCGAAKSDFKPEANGDEKKVVTAIEPMEADLEKLSAGQLAALCSNLARGCEKQYKQEEAGLFKQLADYFTAVVPAVNDASVEKLAKELQTDADNYAAVRATADANADRGAARVCVWGEKVTRMLSSLVNRYLNEGEAMLKDTNIWVCTTCGFVYIGDTPPQLCPVCKVPDWKFEKIEGRA